MLLLGFWEVFPIRLLEPRDVLLENSGLIQLTLVEARAAIPWIVEIIRCRAIKLVGLQQALQTIRGKPLVPIEALDPHLIFGEP